MEKTKKPPKKSKNTKIDRKSQINNEVRNGKEITNKCMF